MEKGVNLVLAFRHRYMYHIGYCCVNRRYNILTSTHNHAGEFAVHFEERE